MYHFSETNAAIRLDSSLNFLNLQPKNSIQWKNVHSAMQGHPFGMEQTPLTTWATSERLSAIHISAVTWVTMPVHRDGDYE